MRKASLVIIAGALALFALVGASPAASATSWGVSTSGTCGTHPWKLRLAHDGARIEADYKLRDVTAGSTWHVVMKDNGVRFFHGTRSAGPDRYIEVDRFASNQTGVDKITVRAVDQATGEVCKASASIT